MWTRYELKKQGKSVFKKNYWAVIAVCFILAFLGAEYTSSVSYIHKYSGNVEKQRTSETEIVQRENHIDNWEILKKWIWGERGERGERLAVNPLIEEALSDAFNSLTNSVSFVFNAFRVGMGKGSVSLIGKIFLIILAVSMELCFTIFLTNVFAVGGKKFFIETRVNPKTKIGAMTDVFRKTRYKNVVKVMFLRSFFTRLWFLTIIGGVVKYYEYLMIPYILAENPNIEYKEAFRLSKEMMRGQKWKTFVLELSFIGWELLSILTFGLVSIFYTNGYRGVTMTELYQILKQNMVDSKKPVYDGRKG